MVIIGYALTEAAQMTQLQCARAKEAVKLPPTSNAPDPKSRKKNLKKLETDTQRNLASDIKDIERFSIILKVNIRNINN